MLTALPICRARGSLGRKGINMPITDTIGTYTNSFEKGYAGMIADHALKDVASRKVENAAVSFGLAVGRGTADGTARLDGAGFEGIAVTDKAQAGADEYAVGTFAGVLRKGSVWVTASTNVSPADPVTFTAATGVIGAGLATTIENATFETSANAGELVRVHLA